MTLDMGVSVEQVISWRRLGATDLFDPERQPAECRRGRSIFGARDRLVIQPWSRPSTSSRQAIASGSTSTRHRAEPGSGGGGLRRFPRPVSGPV